MTKQAKKILFFTIYIGLCLLPMLILVTSSHFGILTVRDISVALGFLGFTIAGMQFLPVSRMPWLSDVIDLDKMYKYHHLISASSVVLVAIHPTILLLTGPLSRSGWTLNSGWLGLAGLVLIALTSIFRRKLNMDYTHWLLLHDMLTLGLLTFGLIHMFRVNYFMRFSAMTAAWIALLVLWIGIGIYMRLVRPLHLGRKPYKVARVVAETEDTYSIYLKAEGFKRADFRAGQVAWINHGPSPFTISRNPFSYSGSTAWDEIRFSIKKAGDFTKTIPHLNVGDTMFVDGPYGTFDLANPRMQKGLVLIGGGIGIAPVMSIVNTLADTGDQRPVFVFYGDYNEKTELFDEELESLKSRMNLTVVKVLEKPLDPEKCEHKGYITKDLMEAILGDKAGELFYFMCGPLPMMFAMNRTLTHMGIDHKQITTENYVMA